MFYLLIMLWYSAAVLFHDKFTQKNPFVPSSPDNQLAISWSRNSLSEVLGLLYAGGVITAGSVIETLPTDQIDICVEIINWMHEVKEVQNPTIIDHQKAIDIMTLQYILHGDPANETPASDEEVLNSIRRVEVLYTNLPISLQT
ncbi:hypothetical protein FHL15_009270 [Xylaria flabelliformis]|uniref:Uncharacterized protein n=1 Tax=Xylaria flabelliformis TaxID=2512241 RepID=A0A553HPG7_9PEZI|nr:hypothetical protein FHL15_009270 [Xylaria flabelliformis]